MKIIRDEEGKLVKKIPGTKPVHPEGNRGPRDKNGRLMNRPAETPEAADREQQIRDAVSALDPDDASLWTSGGKPTLEALEAVLGFKPAGQERDAAWKAAESEENE